MDAVSQAIHRTQRLLAFLLCLLVTAASLDRVPDPPSVKPRSGAAASLTTGIHHLPILNQDRGSVPVASAVIAARFVEWSLLGADTLPVRSPIYLRHASDSSPPYSAS